MHFPAPPRPARAARAARAVCGGVLGAGVRRRGTTVLHVAAGVRDRLAHVQRAAIVPAVLDAGRRRR